MLSLPKHLGRAVRVIVRAEGCYLYDSDGERMLDGMAGLWCVNVGYGRRELADAAYRQMLELRRAGQEVGGVQPAQRGADPVGGGRRAGRRGSR